MKLTREQVSEDRNRILALISALVQKELGKEAGETEILRVMAEMDGFVSSLRVSNMVAVVAMQNLVDLEILDMTSLERVQ